MSKKDFDCCHAELPTKTSTDLVNADSAQIAVCSIQFHDDFDLVWCTQSIVL